MQYFIGIVPPNDFKERIVEFQKRWQSNHTWEVAEPHITVKAQSGLGSNLRWLESIKRICASYPRFTVSIGYPETFGDAVAYLRGCSKRGQNSLAHGCVIDRNAPSRTPKRRGCKIVCVNSRYPEREFTLGGQHGWNLYPRSRFASISKKAT